MRKYNPYRNIFYYYRGPSSKKEEHFDKQLEDNTTKALINTLESSEKRLLMSLLEKTEIDIKHLDRVAYDLQVDVESSRPDALIQIDNKYDILIESKVDARLEKDQICRHLESISNGYLICITPIEGDKNVVQQINKANLISICHSNIFLGIQELKQVGFGKIEVIIIHKNSCSEKMNLPPYRRPDNPRGIDHITVEPRPITIYNTKPFLDKAFIV